MISLKIALVSSIVLASFVSQVYSAKACFTCTHIGPKPNFNLTSECTDDPQRLNFVKSCSSLSHNSAGADWFSRSMANTDKDIEYKCFSGQIKSKDGIEIDRSCIPSYITCELIKRTYKNSEFKIEKCRICDDDLCNSAGTVGITILTMVSCLTSHYILFK